MELDSSRHVNIVLYMDEVRDVARFTKTEEGGCQGCGKGAWEKVLEGYFISVEIFFTKLSILKNSQDSKIYDFSLNQEFKTGRVETGCRTCPVLMETLFLFVPRTPFVHLDHNLYSPHSVPASLVFSQLYWQQLEKEAAWNLSIKKAYHRSRGTVSAQQAFAK